MLDRGGLRLPPTRLMTCRRLAQKPPAGLAVSVIAPRVSRVAQHQNLRVRGCSQRARATIEPTRYAARRAGLAVCPPRPMTSIRAETTDGSNWVPAFARSSSTAWSTLSAER
jgi:hypothetical protein